MQTIPEASEKEAMSWNQTHAPKNARTHAVCIQVYLSFKTRYYHFCPANILSHLSN